MVRWLMPAKYSRHIALTGALVEWVDRQIDAGEYASTSDLIRTALRLLKDRDDGKAASVARSVSDASPVTDRA